MNDNSSNNRKKWLSRQLRDNNSVLILLVLLIVAFTVIDGFNKSFYQALLTAAEYGLVCLGLGMIMMTGNIDLSLGYLATSCGVTFVTVVNSMYAATGSVGASFAVALLVSLVLGLILGGFNGFIITRIGISPLIATIATNYIFDGYVLKFASDSYKPEKAAKDIVKAVGNTQIFGIKWLTPMTLIFVAFIVIFALWMYKTRFGNSVKLVGDNPEAAVFAGIKANNVVFTTYVIAGALCGLCGFLMVSYTGAAIYTQGTALSTLPVACCVLGGIKMSGGKGTVIHILLGVLIMRVISQMMNAMHWQTAIVNFVTGALLIAILLVDRFTSVKDAD